MSDRPSDLLIVDDERTVRASYKALFEREGYAVRVARSGAEALRLFAEHRPDAVILDVDMPGMNGYSVCREMRNFDSETPILFLTAMESDVDQLRGLGVGADDYVFKTASNSVLLARVAAVLSRREAVRSRGASRVIRLGRVEFDADSFELSVDGRPTGERLTMTEAGLLRALDASRGSNLAFEDIVSAMKGEGHVMEYSTFRTHLASLRRKLGPAGALIVNDREIGYRLVR